MPTALRVLMLRHHVRVITEFLQILTDQSNAASSEGGKNTITEAHVVKALKDLEFKHFAAQVEDLAQPAAKAPPRKKNKMKDSGLSQEELLRMQQAIRQLEAAGATTATFLTKPTLQKLRSL
mgnify:CR=1 FL=1